MKIELNKRTAALITGIRDQWFPKETANSKLTLEEFIYILACSLFHNTHKIKKQDGNYAIVTKSGKVVVEIDK